MAINLIVLSSVYLSGTVNNILLHQITAIEKGTFQCYYVLYSRDRMLSSISKKVNQLKTMTF